MRLRTLKWLFLIGTSLLGLAASGTIYQDRLASEEKTQQVYFNEEARIQAMRVELLFDSALSVLDAYTAYFNASNNITRQDYGHFSDQLLANKRELDAIIWVPYVPQAERAAFELQLPPERPHIVEQADASKPLHISPEHPEYFPILYVAPRALQSKLAGLDINARPSNHALRQLARETGQRQTSAPIVDLQSPTQPELVAIYQPIYLNQVISPQTFRGYLVLFLRPQVLLSQHPALRTHNRLVMRLTDKPTADRPLATSGKAELPQNSAYLYQHTIHMPGREWLLTIYPDHLLSHSSTTPEQLFFCLLIISAVLVIAAERMITYLHQLQDVNQYLEQQKKTLDTLASHDPLTGLWNRRQLEAAVEKLLTQPGATHRLAICMLDLDNFKQVNDQHGHRRGDELLRSVADTLRQSTRQGDIVARLGGDEFVLVLRVHDGQTDGSELPPLLQRLLDNIATVATNFSHGTIPVTASMGIALSLPEHRTLAPLLHQADQAMYQAKEAGKNTFAFFSQSDES